MTKEQIRDVIERERNQLGVSVERLSKESKVSSNTIYQLKSKKRLPNSNTMKLLLEALSRLAK